jgi:hypothetical protein
MDETEMDTLVKSRQEDFQRFLAEKNWTPAAYDEDTDSYYVEEGYHPAGWMVIIHHSSFSEKGPTYSVLHSPGLSPHEQVGLVHIAGDML